MRGLTILAETVVFVLGLIAVYAATLFLFVFTGDK